MTPELGAALSILALPVVGAFCIGLLGESLAEGLRLAAAVAGLIVLLTAVMAGIMLAWGVPIS